MENNHSFIMICDNKNNTGKGDVTMFKKYRVNLTDIKDINIFKKIKNVYFDTNEDRLSKKKVEQYLDIEKKILKINPNINIFNSPQIIYFLRNKYVQHIFFQDICQDNPIFFIPDFKIINDETDISKLKIKYPCLIQPSIALTGNFMYFCNSNKELLENYNKILNTYNVTPWHGARNLSQIKIGQDNPIFVREFIESNNSLIDGYRNCIRLMVINNQINEIYVRVNSNNHDVRSCNMDCKFIELNNADKKFYNFYLENKKWFSNFLDNIYKKTGKGCFSIDLIFKDNKIYICEIGHKWYDGTSDKYIKTDRLLEHWRNPIKLLKETIGI